MSAAVPAVLRQADNYIKVTIAGRDIGVFEDDLLTSMRVILHGRVCSLRQGATCCVYLSTYAKTTSCTKCVRNQGLREKRDKQRSTLGE